MGQAPRRRGRRRAKARRESSLTASSEHASSRPPAQRQARASAVSLHPAAGRRPPTPRHSLRPDKPEQHSSKHARTHAPEDGGDERLDGLVVQVVVADLLAKHIVKSAGMGGTPEKLEPGPGSCTTCAPCTSLHADSAALPVLGQKARAAPCTTRGERPPVARAVAPSPGLHMQPTAPQASARRGRPRCRPPHGPRAPFAPEGVPLNELGEVHLLLRLIDVQGGCGGIALQHIRVPSLFLLGAGARHVVVPVKECLAGAAMVEGPHGPGLTRGTGPRGSYPCLP